MFYTSVILTIPEVSFLRETKVAAFFLYCVLFIESIDLLKKYVVKLSCLKSSEVISPRPLTFLNLIFFSTLKCPSLMFRWLLLIDSFLFSKVLSVNSRKVSDQFLVMFSLFLMSFFLACSFYISICHAYLDFLRSTEFLLFLYLIWNIFYLFYFLSVSSLWTFRSFCTLPLVGYLFSSPNDFFMLSLFFLVLDLTFMKLSIYLLIWLECTLQLLLYGW